MKRQYFDISLNGSVVATTFAWNSVIRTIEKLARERAHLVSGKRITCELHKQLVAAGEKDATYKLISSASIRDPNDKYRMLSGHRTWQSDTETLHYTIVLRGSIPTC